MKKGNKIIMASAVLLTASSLVLVSSKITKSERIHGTTLGHYKKPGAPVDIDYTTERIRPGGESHVDITLLTPEKDGTMQVKIRLDRALTPAGDFDRVRRFKLDGSKKYPLSFDVIGERNGVYYIRLLVSMGSKGFRAFAIPLHVGNGQVPLKQKRPTKAPNGENIVVLPAQERIIQH